LLSINIRINTQELVRGEIEVFPEIAGFAQQFSAQV
jgi:hypothetical protein